MIFLDGNTASADSDMTSSLSMGYEHLTRTRNALSLLCIEKTNQKQGLNVFAVSDNKWVLIFRREPERAVRLEVDLSDGLALTANPLVCCSGQNSVAFDLDEQVAFVIPFRMLEAWLQLVDSEWAWTDAQVDLILTGRVKLSSVSIAAYTKAFPVLGNWETSQSVLALMYGLMSYTQVDVMGSVVGGVRQHLQTAFEDLNVLAKAYKVGGALTGIRIRHFTANRTPLFTLTPYIKTAELEARGEASSTEVLARIENRIRFDLKLESAFLAQHQITQFAHLEYANLDSLLQDALDRIGVIYAITSSLTPIPEPREWIKGPLISRSSHQRDLKTYFDWWSGLPVRAKSSTVARIREATGIDIRFSLATHKAFRRVVSYALTPPEVHELLVEAGLADAEHADVLMGRARALAKEKKHAILKARNTVKELL